MNIRSLGFLILAVLALWTGCSTKKDELKASSSTTSGTGGNVAEANDVIRRGDKAPNFSWKDTMGRVVDFDAFHGKVTLINFWATWCGPCKAELPDLVSLSQEMAGRGVKIIGVSTDRGPGATDLVRSFVQAHGIPYQVVVSNDDLDDAFGNPRAIPTSYLVGADGKIAQTIVGMRSKAYFAQAIIALLK